MKHIWVFAALLPLVVTGCTAEWEIPEGYYVECNGPEDCPDSAQCREAEDGTSVCVTSGRPECGNGVRDGDEECDDANANSNDSCINCKAATCGDGFLWDGTEACDSGSDNSNTAVDGCRTDCRLAWCGDGVQDTAELCDDGPNNTEAYGETERCNTSCNGFAPHCGDAIVNGGEVCDDGASNSDSYGIAGRCNTDCNGYAASCGDGFTDLEAEACDDGNTLGGDYCSADCLRVTSVCGDGLIGVDEECDEGMLNADGYHIDQRCLTDCSGYGRACGDGVHDPEEDCEDGNRQDDGNGCSDECKRCDSLAQCEVSGMVRCGDNKVHTEFENCDDGNDLTESCTYGTEFCYVCDESCTLTSMVGRWCGDGIVQQTGLDDDGNDTLEWEGCDSVEDVPCSSLHPALGGGIARCSLDDCLDYDTSGCDNDSVVFVPAGPFMMGCNEEVDGNCSVDGRESPYHEVYLDGYVIDKFEVTSEFYMACHEAGHCSEGNGSTGYITDCQATNFGWQLTWTGYEYYPLPGRESYPANCVNYDDAISYCSWKDKRLPTEAEWEKAARGTDGRIFPWGSALPTCERAVVIGWVHWPDAANANEFGVVEGYGCGAETTWPVGSIEQGASPYGAMDMLGNVAEWVNDWLDVDYYEMTPAGGWINPEGPSSGSDRMLRGGSFNTLVRHLRVSDRYEQEPSHRVGSSGFRCAE